jgi:hypothetical protein
LWKSSIFNLKGEEIDSFEMSNVQEYGFPAVMAFRNTLCTVLLEECAKKASAYNALYTPYLIDPILVGWKYGPVIRRDCDCRHLQWGTIYNILASFVCI